MPTHLAAPDNSICDTCTLQEDLEVLDQKKAAAARAEKMAGQLRKEVRLLQEALADNNIIIDKVCWVSQSLAGEAA